MIARILSAALIPCLLLPACSSHKPHGSGAGTILLEEDGSPFVAFNVWIRCGSSDDPPGKEGLASLTAAFLGGSATRSRSYEEILDRLYPMAADYAVSVDKEMTNFTGFIHEDNLDRYYDLFRETILAPAFDQGDFERVRSRTLDRLRYARRYADDEELCRELLYREIYRGTPYEHPVDGYVSSVESITLEDVQSFYAQNYTRDNITVAVGGAFPAGFPEKMRKDYDALPAGRPADGPKPLPVPVQGIHVLLVEKDTDSSPVSFGFPIDLLRSDADFYAMMVFNASTGEHRNPHGRLFQVIRNARGLNYGDYTYIEAFPRASSAQVPPVNVGRRSQVFEVWLRPVAGENPDLQHARTLFALRAAMRELGLVLDGGLSPERFESTREFLRHYSRNYGRTLNRRLAYRVDDAFYGMEDPGFLASMAPGLDVLTPEDVRDAVRRRIQIRNLWIVTITRDAAGFREKLVSGIATPIEYSGPQAVQVLEEDKQIAVVPIPVREEDIKIIGIDDVFEK